VDSPPGLDLGDPSTRVSRRGLEVPRQPVHHTGEHPVAYALFGCGYRQHLAVAARLQGRGESRSGAQQADPGLADHSIARFERSGEFCQGFDNVAGFDPDFHPVGG